MFPYFGLVRNSKQYLSLPQILLELWDLLSHIAQVAELLKLQSRPAATSFVDLDLNPSQSEKPLTSPKKLSIEVTSSVEYVDYKTQRALQSFVLLP